MQAGAARAEAGVSVVMAVTTVPAVELVALEPTRAAALTAVAYTGRTHPPLATQIAFQRSGHSRGRLAIRRLLGSLLAHTGAATCASCSMSDAAVLREPAVGR
jgi:antitoxin (DNA-binding transcriptional repressor) of toxin-antitoxin stability system